MGTQQQQMEVQDQESQMISKIAKSFNFIIPILIGLVLLVRGKDQSPFETHPSNMWVFMISTFIYYSATQRSMPMATLNVAAMINSGKTCLGDARFLISDIHDLCCEVGASSCKAIPRDSNCIAHGLAQLPFSSGEEMIWRDVDPHCIFPGLR
ncbi:hypothetical protein Q3G72_030130 [Acer saccharum]|nr:hypothetical protein Q3G72_030130 [Acer saccharum]